MKIRNLIVESLSSVVFHATNLDSAIRILKEKKINGSRLGGEYFISFARNRTGDYPKYMGRDMEGTTEPFVVFEFDGRLLSRNNKASAVNPFFDPDLPDYNMGIDYQEDRLFLGKSPSLAVPQGAARRIHVVVNGMNEDNISKIQKLPNHPAFAYYATLHDFMTGKKLSEKPSVPVRWDDVQDAVDVLSYSTSRPEIEKSKRIIGAYLSLNRRDAQSIANLIYDTTGVRGRTMAEILGNF